MLGKRHGVPGSASLNQTPTLNLAMAYSGVHSRAFNDHSDRSHAVFKLICTPRIHRVVDIKRLIVREFEQQSAHRRDTLISGRIRLGTNIISMLNQKNQIFDLHMCHGYVPVSVAILAIEYM